MTEAETIAAAERLIANLEAPAAASARALEYFEPLAKMVLAAFRERPAGGRARARHRRRLAGTADNSRHLVDRVRQLVDVWKAAQPAALTAAPAATAPRVERAPRQQRRRVH
ncbi:MAG: hypothetical protein IPJ65_07185 [Archangiaceae bacterium]|nr:hypothetical protein [Archangiaceae bacterium]